jgi:hypothetical protein
MSTSFAAHPTLYGGTQFRSRLEARWAAFFDLIGWRREYEPFDLQGWVPDFTLSGAGNNPVLVEVKPFILPTVTDEVKAVQEKISRALNGSDWEALLLGVYPFQENGILYCGLFGEAGFSLNSNESCLFWQKAAFTGTEREGFGITPEEGAWIDRIRGERCKLPGCGDEREEQPYLQQLWAEAGNVTRWHP